MKLFKYEFVSKLAFTKQINKLKIELEESNFVYDGVKAIIELGFIQLGVDENKEPIVSDKYCVDIIWKDDKQAENFVSYEIEPKNPKHKIAGW